jgi:hypothetical protein
VPAYPVQCVANAQGADYPSTKENDLARRAALAQPLCDRVQLTSSIAEIPVGGNEVNRSHADMCNEEDLVGPVPIFVLRRGVRRDLSDCSSETQTSGKEHAKRPAKVHESMVGRMREQEGVALSVS